MTRLHVRIQGVVQGVGFRYSTRREACRVGLTGWVRNLPDGGVEAEFEGAPSQVTQFLNWLEHGSRPGQVDLVEMLAPTHEPAYSGFEIR